MLSSSSAKISPIHSSLVPICSFFYVWSLGTWCCCLIVAISFLACHHERAPPSSDLRWGVTVPYPKLAAELPDRCKLSPSSSRDGRAESVFGATTGFGVVPSSTNTDPSPPPAPGIHSVYAPTEVALAPLLRRPCTCRFISAYCRPGDSGLVGMERTESRGDKGSDSGDQADSSSTSMVDGTSVAYCGVGDCERIRAHLSVGGKRRSTQVKVAHLQHNKHQRSQIEAEVGGKPDLVGLDTRFDLCHPLYVYQRLIL
eukprot:m.209595 g.209595  ORF g.209595 m.209595 type:complete len:256 (+) comp25469_c0_seq4:591-1358(+)